jgi:C-terminal processing protease CtpA/Prc
VRNLVRSSTRWRHIAFALWLPSCSLFGPSAPTTGSIGAVLARDEKTGVVRVHDVPEGLAAEDAGVKEGDRLKMIDGVLVDELDAERLRTLLRGPIGSKVRLTVVRGEDVLHLRVTRQALGTKPTAAASPSH